MKETPHDATAVARQYGWPHLFISTRANHRGHHTKPACNHGAGRQSSRGPYRVSRDIVEYLRILGPRAHIGATLRYRVSEAEAPARPSILNHFGRRSTQRR